MIGLVMAGGKGSRMATKEEKLLLKYKKPIILHVIDALIESDYLSKIIAVTSPNAPKTRQLLQKHNIEIFKTSGEDYVKDLQIVLNSISDDVIVTSGDLPFLDGNIVKKIVKLYDPQNVWTSILVTKGFLESLHLSSPYDVTHDDQRCHFTGISLINARKIKSPDQVTETYRILDDKRLAFNLNTKQDLELLGVTS
jgi:adenosylcobinamide-phosphate guanylyltransferase